MIKYAMMEDYDSTYKVKKREISCYSKSKMKELFPDGNFRIAGETLPRNKKKEIDTIELGGKSFSVSKEDSHSSLFFRTAGYVNNGSGEYIVLLRRNFLLLWILLGVLAVATALIILLPKDSGILPPDYTVDDDPNAVTDTDPDEPPDHVIVHAGSSYDAYYQIGASGGGGGGGAGYAAADIGTGGSSGAGGGGGASGGTSFYDYAYGPTNNRLPSTNAYYSYTYSNGGGGTGGNGAVAGTTGGGTKSNSYHWINNGGRELVEGGTAGASGDAGAAGTAMSALAPSAAVTASLTFNANGGTLGETNPTTAAIGAVMPTVSKPIFAGNIFTGWYDAAVGGDMHYDADCVCVKAMPHYDLTLYAQWTNDEAHHGSVDLTAVTDDEKTEKTDNATSFDVLANAKTGEGDDYADITYYVTIAWSVDTESINITEGDVYEWSTTELKYVPVSDGDGALVPGGNAATTVTVTNRSNAAVTYDISFDATATTGLTTSEAKAEASTADATGTLDSADKNGASADATGSGHVYKINAANIDATGNAEQSAEYKGTVTVTEIADDTEIENNDDLTLGTYTVTLGAPNTASGETE